jgi:parallel beta-helix repeat protein
MPVTRSPQPEPLTPQGPIVFLPRHIGQAGRRGLWKRASRSSMVALKHLGECGDIVIAGPGSNGGGRMVKFLIPTVAALASFSALAAAGGDLALYVAGDGNDTWSGSLPAPAGDGADGPFATVERAVEEVRKLKKNQGGALTQPVRIVFREGTYFLAKPLVLTPEDSGSADCPVTFASYPGERAVVSGGRPVSGWRKVGDSLWAADLPGVREGEWYFRTLRVNDDWAVQARYPDFDPEHPRKGGWLYARQMIAAQDGGLFGVGVGKIHNAGDRLEWEAHIPAGGDYTVWVRYGHRMKDYGRDTMDGRTVFGVASGPEAPLVDLPDTGSWGATRWGRGAALHLGAGKQTLYWENRKGGGLDLDAFLLCSDPDWNPAQAVHIQSTGEHSIDPPAAGKHAVLIHAETCVKAVGPEVSVGTPAPKASKEILIMDEDAFPEWGSWEGADLHVFPAWGWVNTVITINGTDRDRSALLIDSPQEIRPGNRFFIAGTRAALDSPGEWCLDKQAGQLLYWPAEGDFPNAEVVAPAMDRLVVFQGEGDAFVEHIRFRGLTFMDSTYTLGHTYSPADAAIRLTGARHCAVEDCTFTRLAGYAVLMDEGSHDNAVVHNTMTDIGQGGVMIVGDTATQAHDNLIAANTMTDIGLIYKHVAGVYVTTGSGNRIVHNRIHRVPRYGISLKSYSAENYSHDNLVEFNELIDTNLETNDTGAIETLGRDRQDSGNIIRFNLLRNAVGLKTSPEGEIMSPYFTWGIYLDDYSSGTTIYGNIVDGTVIGGFCIHGGKNNHVENNIFLNASSQQLRLQPRDDFMRGNTFKNNIVAYQDPDTTLWYAYDKTWRPDRLSECDHNLYWCYGDPDIAGSDRVITPEGTYADWLKSGFDAHSVVADPGFVSPELSHFGLRPDSPALAIGYKPIPEDKIGPEGYERE